MLSLPSALWMADICQLHGHHQNKTKNKQKTGQQLYWKPRPLASWALLSNSSSHNVHNCRKPSNNQKKNNTKQTPISSLRRHKSLSPLSFSPLSLLFMQSSSIYFAIVCCPWLCFAIHDSYKYTFVRENWLLQTESQTNVSSDAIWSIYIHWSLIRSAVQLQCFIPTWILLWQMCT